VSLDFRKENEHPSHSRLRQYHVGDLGKEERRLTSSHLDECEECVAFLKTLDEEKKAFYADHDRAGFLTKVREGATRPSEIGVTAPKNWLVKMLQPGLLAPATAALVLLLIVVLYLPGEEGSSERMKGNEIGLDFLVMENDGPRVAEPGRVLHPGDRIQFRVTAPAGGFIHIVSVDEAGTVSVYFPLPHSRAERYPGGAARPVPGSVILDDTLGRERVFMLLCGEPMQREQLAKAVLTLEGGPKTALETKRLPLECRQLSLLLTKGPR